LAFNRGALIKIKVLHEKYKFKPVHGKPGSKKDY